MKKILFFAFILSAASSTGIHVINADPKIFFIWARNKTFGLYNGEYVYPCVCVTPGKAITRSNSCELHTVRWPEEMELSPKQKYFESKARYRAKAYGLKVVVTNRNRDWQNANSLFSPDCKYK